MNKRIVSLITALLLIFNIACISVGAQTDYFKEADDTVYEEAVYLLNALGILKSETSGAYDLNANATRAEFCAMVSRAMGADFAESSFGANTFSDVPETHWAAGYIETLAAMGIVSGHGDGIFAPDEHVLYEEAVKMIVDMLGYTPLAEQYGGYPDGYIKCATEIKLLNDVKVYFGFPIKNGTLVQLLYNSLTIDFMRPRYVQDTSFIIKENENLLSSVFKLEKRRGYVTGSYQTGITAKNTVEIDGVRYDMGETNAEDFLGKRIDYYARDSKTGTEQILVYARPVGIDEKFVVEAADIISVNGIGTTKAVMTYYASHLSKPKATELRLDKDLRVIYNNKEKTPVTEGMLQPICGKVEFLDSHGDGVYDIAFVTDYDRRIVREVITNDDLIYFSDGTSLDLYNKKVTIVKGGEKTDIYDIVENDVLNIVQSEDEKIVEIYISDKQVQGTITEISDDTIIVGGEEYRVDPSAKYSSGFSLSLHDNANFYFDIMGNIFYYEIVENTDAKYGYLVKIGADKSTLDPEVSIQLCEEDRKFTIYKVAKRIMLDNVYVDAEKLLDNPKFIDNTLLKDNKTVKQLIIFKTNTKDEIIMIDTWEDLRNSTEPTKNMGYDLKNFTRVAPVPQGDELPWWQSYQGANSVNNIWMNNVGFFGQKYSILNDTIVIKVPVGVYEEEETAYSVAYGNNGRILINKNGWVPELELYDANEVFGLGAIVYKGDWTPADTVATNTQILLLTGVNEAINDEGNIVCKVYGLLNNKTVSYETNEKTYETFKLLKPGDAVQVNTIGSEIVAARVVFTGVGTDQFYIEDVYAGIRYYGDTFDKAPEHHPANQVEYRYGEYLTPVHIAGVFTMIYGELAGIDEDRKVVLLYTGGDKEKGTRAYNVGGRIYVYDTKREIAYVGTSADFNVNEPSKVLLRSHNYGSQDFVIFK